MQKIYEKKVAVPNLAAIQEKSIEKEYIYFIVIDGL